MAIALACSSVAASAGTAMPSDPIRFFEGRTESLGTVRIAMKKPFRSRAVGKGQIMADGSLTLIQQVEDQGQQPRERRWRIHKVGPGRYKGTMSDAHGPVTVEEVDGRYRFRFRMEGNVAVEQWLIPAENWRSAASKVTIRKYGLLVGRSEAVIRKLD